MIPSKILDKIKKCFALSESCNPNEAATALRQAEKLMNKYNVSQADLTLSDVAEEFIDTGYKRYPSYLNSLIAITSKAFKVTPLQDGRFGNVKVVLLGDASSVELVRYVYSVLENQLKQQMSKEKKAFKAQGVKASTATTLTNKFAIGWVCGVGKVVDSFSESLTASEKKMHMDRFKANAEEREGKKGLAIMTKADAKRSIRLNSSENEAFQNGKAAGNKAAIFAGVTSQGTASQRLGQA